MKHLSTDQFRRLSDLAFAQKLATSGHVSEARKIFAYYGISYVAAEVNRTKPVKP